MAQQEIFDMAKETFATLCSAMDNNNWSYRKNEEDMAIECSVRIRELPIDISVTVDAERAMVALYSPMRFVVERNKRIDMAVAVSAVNNLLSDGCFDYNVSTGRMLFRMSSGFVGNKISEKAFSYMIGFSSTVITEFQAKMSLLNDDLLSLEQFLALIEN